MSDAENPDAPGDEDRRDFLQTSASTAMAGGLLGGYGTFAVIAGRFLYPSRGSNALVWQFVSTIDNISVGASLDYRTPRGATVVIARQSAGETADAFIALSSVCPHLGCQVHWEAVNNRFFCPCHNGAFDASGQPVAGPPLTAGQQLTRFPLKVENGLLYIQVPVDGANGGSDVA